MNQKSNLEDLDDRRWVSLSWLARRWGCSRQTCRRVLAREGSAALLLGGTVRNGTLRFELEEILKLESRWREGTR